MAKSSYERGFLLEPCNQFDPRYEEGRAVRVAMDERMDAIRQNVEDCGILLEKLKSNG